MLDEDKKASSGKKRVSVDSIKNDDNSINPGLEARKKYLAEREKQKEILRKEEEERIRTAKREEEKKAEYERQEIELAGQKQRIKHLRIIYWSFIVIPLIPIIVSLCMIPKYFFMYAWQIVLLVLFGLFTVAFVVNCAKLNKESPKIKEKVDACFNGTILTYLASVIFLIITISLSCVYKYDRLYKGYDNGYFYRVDRQGYAKVFRNAAPELRIPLNVDGKSVKSFWLMGDRDEVKKVYLPDSFDIIKSDQFFEFSNLEYVELPRTVSKIETDSFNNCRNLKTPSFGPSLESIDNCAFWGCRRFEMLSFQEGLKSIDSFAFGGCESLSYVKLPNSIEKLGRSVFKSCDLLKTINFMGTVERWNGITKEEYTKNEWSKTEYWYSDSNIEKVICLDGTITIER